MIYLVDVKELMPSSTVTDTCVLFISRLASVYIPHLFTWIFFNETYCLASKGFTLDKILETSFTLIRNK